MSLVAGAWQFQPGATVCMLSGHSGQDVQAGAFFYRTLHPMPHTAAIRTQSRVSTEQMTNNVFIMSVNICVSFILISQRRPAPTPPPWSVIGVIL